MANPTNSPGPGYVWVPGSAGGEDPSHATEGYWMAPGDPNTQNNYNAGAAITGWTLPKAPGASYFQEGTGNPWVTPGLQRSMEQFFRTPTSGYGDYYGVQDYGAQLPRWQFSHSAPVPATAPVGWGRYPGVGGSPGPAPWVTNGNGGGQAGAGATGNWTSNSGVPSGGYQNPTNLPQNNGTTPPIPVTPPSNGGNSNPSYPPGTPPGYPPGFNPGTTPLSTQGWMPPPATTQVSANTLSGFRFQNAAPGSVQANYNAIAAKYGPNDALNYLYRNGYNNGAVSTFTNAMKSGGMSSEDVARITNQFSAGGAGGVFNNSLEGFNGGVYSNGTDQVGLLASLGIQDNSARDALNSFLNARRSRRGQ